MRAGHRGNLRAPHAAGDDDIVRLDVTSNGADALDPALLDVDTDHLHRRYNRQRIELHSALTHDRPGTQRVDDTDRRGPERPDDDRWVEVRHLLDDLLGSDELGVDAPGLRR
jgi:hypothetical protein